MSCALRVNTATQVKVSFHLLRRGAAKRGWCCVAPSPFAAWSAAPVILPVYLLSLRGLCGGRFPANVPPSPQRPSEAKAWPHPSALPPLALGKPASPRTGHWLAPYIARWFAQRRARRGNAYSVGYAGLVCFCETWSLRGIVHSRSAFCLSRQRHGAGMNQKRLHRHATAAVCGSCAPTKNPCRTKTQPSWRPTRRGSYAYRQIADHFEVHFTTVGRIVSGWGMMYILARPDPGSGIRLTIRPFVGSKMVLSFT